MSTHKFPGNLQRVGLWFASLSCAVGCFSWFIGHNGSVLVIFGITMIFALPVAILYLPFVLAHQDAEGRRIWLLLVSGILIGPVSMFLWMIILLLRGYGADAVWRGDAEGLSAVSAMTCALIVGSTTTAIYVATLKILHGRLTPGT